MANKRGFDRSIARNFDHNKGMKYRYYKFSENENFIYNIDPNSEDLFDVEVSQRLTRDNPKYVEMATPVDPQAVKEGREIWVTIETFKGFPTASKAMDFINNKYFSKAIK